MHMHTQFAALEGTPLPGEVSLGSQLLTSFQELLLSIYINILSLLDYTLSGFEESEQLLLSDQLSASHCVISYMYMYRIAENF